MQPVPFGLNATTVSLSATATAQSVQGLAGASTIRVVNLGANTAFLKTGDSTVAATVTAGTPVPAGVVEVFSKSNDEYISAICASGESATLYFTFGQGT